MNQHRVVAWSAVVAVLWAATPVLAKGRQPGDGDFEVPKSQRGSAANPNPAYAPPAWDYTPASRQSRPSSDAKNKAPKAGSRPANVPAEAPAPDAFPDYSTPQPAAAPPPPPLAPSHGSVEPPLPDEPGGDPNKLKNF